MEIFTCEVIKEDGEIIFIDSEEEFDSELLDFAGYEFDMEDNSKYKITIKYDYTPQTYDSPAERILEVIGLEKAI